MFDFNKTIALIKGGLLEPRATWQSYLTENRGWQDTVLLLTLPLIVTSYVLSGILSLIFRSYYMYRVGMGFGGWLLGIILAVLGIVVASFIFSYLAGVFKGRNDFNRGLAALSLAAIPGYLGGILNAIPYIGWIIALALGIVSLVYLYQILPSYLEVPEEKHVLHYVVSLVCSFVVMWILVLVLGFGGAMSTHRGMSMIEQQPSQVGMLGGIQRYAQYMERAQQDSYDPPADGKISEAQMNEYMDVMRKAAEIRGEQMAHVDKLKEQYKDKDPGAGDLPELAGGIGAVLGAFNAEMEVVMTGKGNWAEHQWVAEQLHTARIQKDINEAVKHNYALYQANQAELEKISAQP